MAISPKIIKLAQTIQSKAELNGLDAASIIAFLKVEITDTIGSISSADFYEQTDKVELAGLTPAQTSEYDRLLMIQQVDMSAGAAARAQVDALFLSGGNTQNNLTNKLTQTLPRRQAWNFPSYRDREIEQAVDYINEVLI